MKRYKVSDCDGEFQPFYTKNLLEVRDYIYDLSLTNKTKKELKEWIATLNTYDKCRMALKEVWNIKLERL